MNGITVIVDEEMKRGVKVNVMLDNEILNIVVSTYTL